MKKILFRSLAACLLLFGAAGCGEPEIPDIDDTENNGENNDNPGNDNQDNDNPGNEDEEKIMIIQGMIIKIMKIQEMRMKKILKLKSL